MSSHRTVESFWSGLRSGCTNGFALIGLFSVCLLTLHALGPEIPIESARAQSYAPAPIRTTDHRSANDLKLSRELTPQELLLASAPAPSRRLTSDPRRESLAKYIARSYRIANDAADELVTVALESAKMVGLDPIIVLAVMAIESRFNPIAESHMGAKGLMQVIPQMHLDKLVHHGGGEAVLDPWVNIHVGTQILQEYIQRAGSIEAGLQLYNGAASDTTNQYAQKVLAERQRLEQVLPRAQRRPA